MNVLVNGIGNIGTTVIQLLLKYKNLTGIRTIYANKNSLKPWQLSELEFLKDQGIIVTTTTKENDFEWLENVIQNVDYIFECGTNGSGIKNKRLYDTLPNLKGVCAQGSEKGFGHSFMSGVNDETIRNKKFVHVVSCNTHGTASLLKTFCGTDLENLLKGDFVVVRRSEDIGNHERLVSANVVARHLDSKIGTHHAIDVVDLFDSLQIKCDITSSDITTPSQLMHAVRFHIELKNKINFNEIQNLIASNSFLSTTRKYDSNVIFEQGRRYGFNGRIFSHAIVVSENLLISDNSLKGWAFVPQEGNSILSTLHAFLLQMNHPNEKEIMKKIKMDLLKPEW